MQKLTIDHLKEVERLLSKMPKVIPGLKLIVNDELTEYDQLVQFRFPKSKKKRINNKWKKKPENYRMQKSHKLVIIDNCVYVNSKAFKNISI